MAEARPDVVHTNFCVPGVIARLVAHRLKVPTIVSTQHETWESMYPHYRWAVRWSEACAHAIVYVSRTVADSFRRPAVAWREEMSRSIPRHLVIPNGIDLSIVERVRRAVSGREAEKLVCVGRLVAGKGHELLLEALHHVRMVFPRTNLTLVGGGPLEKQLRQRAVELGISGAVEFRGSLPYVETLREMAEATAVVAPSTGPEGFGMVIAESLALGTPVVATRTAAFEEIFGEENVHFAAAEPRCLARTLREILVAPERAGAAGASRCELGRAACLGAAHGRRIPATLRCANRSTGDGSCLHLMGEWERPPGLARPCPPRHANCATCVPCWPSTNGCCG